MFLSISISSFSILFVFNIVLMEIEERRKFLDEMEALGQGAKYRSLINTEISQVRLLCHAILCQTLSSSVLKIAISVEYLFLSKNIVLFVIT